MTWMRAQIADLAEWLAGHLVLSGWVIAASVLVSLLGILAVRWLVLRIPADYFVAPRTQGWRERHPVVRWTLVIAKNLLGAILLVLGIAMLVAPGPGIVTLLVAVILLDVPGKHALERRIITLPSVLRVINHMRRRANRPLLEAPAIDAPAKI
jgi:hypothetical protein